MKKGKTLTLLVLAVEIASIVVLHAVKINHTEKAAIKEVSRNSAPEQADSRTQASYSLALFR